MKFFDTHAHYNDDKFSLDADSLLTSLFHSSVDYIVNVGTSPKTSLQVLEQAKQYPHMYVALGIHPTDAQELEGTADENLKRIEDLILKNKDKCVAIGEIGLDYHYEDTNKALQMEYFEKQLQMAERLHMIVSVHDRDSHGDIFDTLLKYPQVKGIIHSCSMSYEMAKELQKRGWYISFSGTVSFTNARSVKDVASRLDPNRILVETDAPYLAPHPHRGERNDSSYLEYTIKALAECLNQSYEDTCKLVYENAMKCFFNN